MVICHQCKGRPFVCIVIFVQTEKKKQLQTQAIMKYTHIHKIEVLDELEEIKLQIGNTNINKQAHTQ
jgi:hypothetical protein